MLPLLFLALALVGVALIVAPRVRSRRKRAPWRSGGGGSIRATRGRAAVAAPSATRAWAGSDASELDDEWDDELGWEDAPRAGAAPAPDPAPTGRLPGSPAPAPALRAASAGVEWPRPAGAEPHPAPAARAAEPHGESVRSAAPAATGRATTFDWSADTEPPADAAPPGAANGAVADSANGHATPPAAANGAVADSANGHATPPSADDFAEPDPDAPLELEDDDWLAPPPPPRSRLGSAGAAPGYAPPRGKPRKRLFSPVVLVGIYAVGGIGLVVLGVSLLSGSMGGGDRPAAPAPVAATSTPVATPAATVAPVATPAAIEPSPAELARREDAARSAARAATAAAERAEAAARKAERRRIARERRARARVRAEAEAEARRRRAPAPVTSTPSLPPPFTPAPAPPSSGGGGGGSSDCEFCIG